MNFHDLNDQIRDIFHEKGYHGEDVTVCILDYGVDPLKQFKKLSYGNEYLKTRQSHGTEIAGIINEWLPEARIISYSVFGDGEYDYFKLVEESLKDIIKRKKAQPDIYFAVNISSNSNIFNPFQRIRFMKMRDLIEELNKNDVPVFVAAGNDGNFSNYDIYPASFRAPITVSSIDEDGLLSRFSTFMNEVDFTDVGEFIKTVSNGGGEAYVSGTSFSAPTVLSKAALLAQQIHDETGVWPTEPQIYDELILYCMDITGKGKDKYTGYGFIDLREVHDEFRELNEEQEPLTFWDELKEWWENFKDRFRHATYINARNIVFTRDLKQGMTGTDVRAVKDKLVELGYLAKSTHNTFGSDTTKAVKAFQTAKGFEPDGIVGMLTWQALFSDQPVPEDEDQDPTYHRVLKLNMKGADVKAAKDRLYAIGYLFASTKSNFGPDTERAVEDMQRNNGLSVTGEIDQLTWTTLFSDDVVRPKADDIPAHINKTAAAAIQRDLKGISEVRKKIVLDCLKYAVDPYQVSKYPIAFYVRGGNAYNKDLTPNIMTKKKLDSYLNSSRYSEYTDGGRAEMMRAASEASGYTNMGCDCSGLCVGELKVFKVVNTGFDANANSLYSSYCKNTSNPLPGDMMWKSGHAGIYVGGGYCVEAAGGAYGLQMTKVSDRRIYNFVDHKIHKFSKWTAYGRWKMLKD